MNSPRPRWGKPGCAGWGCLGLWLVGFSVIILAYVTTGGEFDPKQVRAHLVCRHIAQAIEAYESHGANKERLLPTQLAGLVSPTFGAPSFLRNGEADLIDPWGKPYRMERLTARDGEPFILIKTTAPDGTPISQFGIGEQADPTF